MEDKVDHDANNENSQFASDTKQSTFQLLKEQKKDIKNTPKKKGKGAADQHSIEKTDGKDQDGNESQ